MSLSSGRRFGPYEIVSLLGKGGMGEVYRARDTRLGREVALKMLPDSLRRTPELRERLEREARAISQLQHPNVCALFDIGHQDDTDYLVMELLEGETLAERLARGPVPMAEALDTAARIAGAIERAHRRGIVHRDLKPGNVMLTPHGPKVLDFGLAKDVVPAGPVTADSASPTAMMTGEGMIVGTLHYMAPEQLQGKAVDARTDVFAFGCMLFEMLTGKRPFEGEDQASVIAAVLRSDVPPLELQMQALGLAAPPALARVVERCLAKDPDIRWQAMGDVEALLEDVSRDRLESSSAISGASVPGERTKGKSLALAGGVALLVAALAFAAGRHTVPDREPESTPRFAEHFLLEVPELMELQDITNPALSRDGRQVAFIGQSSDGPAIWVRQLDELTARPVEGPENPGWVTFSPDGEWLAYFDVLARAIKKVSVHGGRPVTLVEPGYIPFHWGSDGFIYYPPRAGSRAMVPEEAGLARIDTVDGEPQQLTVAEETDPSGARLVHTSPQFLPGDRLLFSVGSGFLSTGWDVAVLDLASGEWKRVFDGANQAAYFEGYLFFWRDDRIWAAPFDLDRLETTGPTRPVMDNVNQHPSAPLEVGQFQSSDDGSLVYVSGGTPGGEWGALLYWEGSVSTEITRLPGLMSWPRRSPDGHRVAVDRCELQPPQGRLCRAWIYDLEDASWRPVSPPDVWAGFPAWDRSGQSILVEERSQRGHREIVRHSLTPGVSSETLYSRSDGWIVPLGTSSDGRVIFTEGTERGSGDVMALTPDGEVSPLLADEFDANATDLSADGRWLIFDTNRTGRQEVFALDLEDPSGSPRQLVDGRFGALSPSQDVLYWRSHAYPGAAEILRADVDLGRGRIGEASIVTTTSSINTSAWFSLGGLAADDNGLWGVLSESASTGGRVILVKNWAEDITRKLERD